MNLPIAGKLVDERFLNHRLRSTSIAGVTCALVVIGLFLRRFYANHIWSWDLLAVALINVGMKVTMMAWYRLRA